MERDIASLVGLDKLIKHYWHTRLLLFSDQPVSRAVGAVVTL